MGTTGPTRWRFPPFAAGAIGIIVIVGIYCTVSWPAFSNTIKFCKELFCDFIDYYYPMGAAIFHTATPIEGFYYSPFAAILFSGIAPLEIGTSLVIWGVVQALSVVLMLLTFRHLVPNASLPLQLLYVALVVSSYPLWLNIKAGSVGVITTVALLGVLAAMERGHRVIAALLLAFAVSFKFYPIIFLAPIAASRDKRWLAYSLIACATTLFVIPAFLLGAGETIQFYSGLFDAFRNTDWVHFSPHSNYLPHILARLTDLSADSSPTLIWTFTLIAYTVAAANIGLVYLIQRTQITHAHLWSFVVVFLTVPFVLKTSWETDFVFLPLVQTTLLWRLHEDRPIESAGQYMSQRKGGRLSLVVISMVASSIFFFHLLGNFVGYGSAAFLFHANLILLFVLYAELLPEAIRRWRSAPRSL